MMRLAIMQPYFLPYIGYFQLMAAVDKFVLLDDVNFINGGWINRNRIAVKGKLCWLTLPLRKASQNRLINEIEIIEDPVWKRKALRTVELGYADASFAPKTLPFFREIVSEAKGSLSAFLFRSLGRVAEHIGISTEIEPTSAIYAKEGRTGQNRILDICTREGATSYVNLPGGRDLYDTASFASAGVELVFLESNIPETVLQCSGDQGPILSILDLLMLNSSSAIRAALSMSRLERT